MPHLQPTEKQLEAITIFLSEDQSSVCYIWTEFTHGTNTYAVVTSPSDTSCPSPYWLLQIVRSGNTVRFQDIDDLERYREVSDRAFEELERKFGLPYIFPVKGIDGQYYNCIYGLTFEVETVNYHLVAEFINDEENEDEDEDDEAGYIIVHDGEEGLEVVPEDHPHYKLISAQAEDALEFAALAYDQQEPADA